MILALALAAALSGLKPGATVTLPAGTRDTIEFRNQHFDPPVTIDARAATVRGVSIWDSSGIIWRGGTIIAPKGTEGEGPGIKAIEARRVNDITIDGVTFTRAARGVTVADSQNVSIRNSLFTALRTDGIDLAGVSAITIENNRFEKFFPVKPTGSKADGNWKDGDHPDAVQIWTTKLTPYGRDITIRGNKVDGDTQGINFFGARGNGYSHVTIADNTLALLYPAAISVFDCTDCTVQGNRVETLPGAKFPANIRFENSTGKACGNTMPGRRQHFAMDKCPAR